ncbi:MAG: FKBP-type peptidyl-prolyl cis-trans isomerase [Myxococcota bacterium]
MAQVEAKKVVTIRYVLRNQDGDELERAEDPPLRYLHGAAGIVPGLERALQGRRVGEHFEVEVSAREGYGPRIADAEVEVPRSVFPDDAEVTVGTSFVAEGPDGEAFSLWVVGVEGDVVRAEPNHPLAGLDLSFSVDVVAVRDATGEEVAQGRVDEAHGHGADGPA